MLNGITNVADAQSLLQNSASQEIYGTSYEDAINTTVVGGGLAILAGAGVYAGTAVARNVGGFSVASVIPEITAKVGAVGTWLAKPKAVLVKAGSALSTGTVGVLAKGAIWAVGVAVASALGLKIGSLTYNWIEENRPDAWVWLDERLTAIGWRDFDFALAENGISYLPTAIVELYRSWFEYLGFFTAGGYERLETNTALSYDAIETIPYFDAFSEYTDWSSSIARCYQHLIDYYEIGEITENDYVVLTLSTGRYNQAYATIFKNVHSISFNRVGAYSRKADGSLNSFTVTVDADKAVGMSDDDVRLVYFLTRKTQSFEFNFTSITNYIQDNLGNAIPTVEGVTIQTGATLPNSNVPLSTTYPDWYANKMSITTPNTSVDFLPVAIPQVDPLVDDTILSQTDAQTGVVDNTKPWVGTQLEIGSNSAVQDLMDRGVNVPSNPPMTPIGTTPTNPVTPLDDVGMISIYNPTIRQVNELSQFLWSGFDVDTFKKLLSDPMDGIVTFFKMYATPSTSDVVDNIRIGYINTGVESKSVNDQFAYVDCGTIRPYQYYGNILDFEPYTSVKIYLPFIGIVPLSANHVITKTLNVRYKIDVLTGTCCALIYCDDVLTYVFNGNCAVQVPLTGINFQNTISSLINIGVGIGTLVKTKGAFGAGMTARAVGDGLGSANFQQSGTLGSNAGVLAPRIPYLLIERPKSYDAVEYPKYYGIPSNKTVKIANLQGYTRVKEIHPHNIECTDEELKLIEETLRGGFII